MFEVALEAEVGVALDEHFLVNGTVRVMAAGAAFTQGVVLKNERPFLRSVTRGAGFVFALETARAAFDGVTFVRVVAIGAAHLAR